MEERRMLQPSVRKLDPREEHYWIAAPRNGLQLFLRHLSPAAPARPIRPVLYVHGATFPSALSIAHRFDRYSWRDALCEAGFDVWGFDFLGYGYSDRYPEMSAPAADNPPLCDAQDASEQVEAVVRFILERCKASNLSLITSLIGSHRLIQRVGEAANMPFSIHPHMLRHACGFNLANDGHDTRRTTSGTRTSSTRSDTPKWRPTSSRTFGEADLRPWTSWCRRFRAPASSGPLPLPPQSPWHSPQLPASQSSP